MRQLQVGHRTVFAPTSKVLWQPRQTGSLSAQGPTARGSTWMITSPALRLREAIKYRPQTSECRTTYGLLLFCSSSSGGDFCPATSLSSTDSWGSSEPCG
uniref:(northern house mosquito) hypothetical protein n=1 Tax=Culex pipiens TaxID=7175 RepID=A0A8D8ATB1_CULPI